MFIFLFSMAHYIFRRGSHKKVELSTPLTLSIFLVCGQPTCRPTCVDWENIMVKGSSTYYLTETTGHHPLPNGIYFFQLKWHAPIFKDFFKVIAILVPQKLSYFLIIILKFYVYCVWKKTLQTHQFYWVISGYHR